MLDRRFWIAKEIAAALLSDRSDGPGCVLPDVGAALGAGSPVYRTTFDTHGLTDWRHGKVRIELRLTHIEGRRRAAWAHELGHVLLDPLLAPASLRSWDLAGIQRQQERSLMFVGSQLTEIRALHEQIGLERLCDAISYELLLPIAAVPRIARSITDVQSLMNAADLWRVSLSFLVLRIKECTEQDIALIHLQSAYDGKWVVTDCLGNLHGWSMGTTVDHLGELCLNDLPTNGIAETVKLAPMTHPRALLFSVCRRKDKAVALWLGRSYAQTTMESDSCGLNREEPRTATTTPSRATHRVEPHYSPAQKSRQVNAGGLGRPASGQP